jgi:hypothetical protein
MNDTAVGKLFADLEKAEAKLTRAFNKWVKLKAKVRRFDKQVAKAFDAEAIEKGGKPWADGKGGMHLPDGKTAAKDVEKARTKKTKR